MWMQHLMHLCLVTEKLQQQQNVTLTICHRTDSSFTPPGGQLPKPANPGGGLEHLGSPRRVHKPGATLGEGGAGSTNNPYWAASTTTGASVSTTPGANSSVILSIYYYSELKMQNGCEWIPILFQGKSTWDSQEITGRWGNWKKENDPLSSKCNSILGLL